MDLILYEAAPFREFQDQPSGSVTASLREVQNQAAAWLRKAVVAVVPGPVARSYRREEQHG